MNKQNIQGIVSHRKFTHEEWSNSDPILFNGEIIFVEMEDRSLKQKIGDGVSKYSELEFYIEDYIQEKITEVENYADETKPYTIILTCGSVPEISDNGISIYTVNNIAVSAVGISGGLSDFSENDLFSSIHYLDGHGYTGARVLFQLDSSKMCEYIGEIPLMRMDRDGSDSTYYFTKTVVDNGTLVQVNIYYYSFDKTWSVEVVPINKTEIGLGNIDNTSDLDKPISNATQLALNEINSKIGDINPILTQVHNYAQNTYLGGGEE